MEDLHFTYSMAIVTDFEQAIEAHGGEIMLGVPDDIAKSLLRRPDVKRAAELAGQPKFDDIPRRPFSDARRHPDHIAKLIAPAMDEHKLVEDLERAQKGAEAKRRLTAMRASDASASQAGK